MRNAGNIPISVMLSVMEHKEMFSVIPGQVEISPGQEAEVMVRFEPPDVKSRTKVHR